MKNLVYELCTGGNSRRLEFKTKLLGRNQVVVGEIGEKQGGTAFCRILLSVGNIEIVL